MHALEGAADIDPHIIPVVALEPGRRRWQLVAVGARRAREGGAGLFVVGKGERSKVSNGRSDRLGDGCGLAAHRVAGLVITTKVPPGGRAVAWPGEVGQHPPSDTP